MAKFIVKALVEFEVTGAKSTSGAAVRVGMLIREKLKKEAKKGTRTKYQAIIALDSHID